MSARCSNEVPYHLPRQSSNMARESRVLVASSGYIDTGFALSWGSLHAYIKDVR